MIPAPILPRTRESLWELLETEPQRVERGFEILDRELVIEEGIVVDAVARDSAGRLVLLFLHADGDDARELPLRAFAASQWVTRNARLLLSALPADSRQVTVPARLVVVGFDLPEDCVRTLVDSGIRELSIYRCEAFVLSGRVHAGMSPVHPTTGDAEVDTPSVPQGVRDADLRRVGEEIVEVLSRLDPKLEVRGDRYSRRFYTSHGLLAELYVVDGPLYVATLGGDEPQRVSASDSRRIADSLVRAYLAQIDRPEGAAARRQAVHDALADVGVSDDEPRTGLRIDHALRPRPAETTFGDTEVSQEEFDAFRGLSSEKET